MFPGLQRRRIRLQLQFDEHHGERRSVAFRARDRHFREPGVQLHRGKNRQRKRRRGQHQSTVLPDGHLVGIRVAAESFAENFKAVGQRSHVRGRGNLHRWGRGLGGREDYRRHAPRTALDGAKNCAGIQRRHE